MITVEPSSLYGTPFDPQVLEELAAGLSDHEAMEQQFGAATWLEDQYRAASTEMRNQFLPAISTRFEAAGASSVWLDGPVETAIVIYAVLRHVRESCPHYSTTTPGPYVAVLDHGWIGCDPCAVRRVETNPVDDDPRCRCCDEVPEKYVPLAVALAGTMLIADVCLACRSRFMRT
jgi:hypothetical protein